MEMMIKEATEGVVDVALVGRLDTPGVSGIELRFTATLVPRAARAVVDLSQVEFIGSMGIRMLISVARALSKKQGNWCYTNRSRWSKKCSTRWRWKRSFPCSPTLPRRWPQRAPERTPRRSTEDMA